MGKSKIEQIIKAVDQFDEEGGFDTSDDSGRLKSAKFHFQAFCEATEQFASEADADEQDHLRSKIDFHRSRLQALLG